MYHYDYDDTVKKMNQLGLGLASPTSHYDNHIIYYDNMTTAKSRKLYLKLKLLLLKLKLKLKLNIIYVIIVVTDKYICHYMEKK